MAERTERNLRTLRGGRVSVRQKRGSGGHYRILLLTGMEVINLDNGYRMEITKPIEVSVPEEAVGYSPVGD